MKKGQPVLVGTASIEKEWNFIKFYQIKNSSHCFKCKTTWKRGKLLLMLVKRLTVTIATNMAGRGVDIKLTPEILERVD